MQIFPHSNQNTENQAIGNQFDVDFSAQRDAADAFAAMLVNQAEQLKKEVQTGLSWHENKQAADYEEYAREVVTAMDEGGYERAVEAAENGIRKVAEGHALPTEPLNRGPLSERDRLVVKETLMTREDFAKVKDDLKKFGLDDEAIQELEDRIGSGEMTWGQFVHAVMPEIEGKLEQIFQGVELNASDKTQLVNLFEKMGFNPKESKELLNDISEGKFLPVLAKVQLKLNTLPDDALISINPKEIETLVKALQLPKEDLKQFQQFLAQFQAAEGEAAEMSPKDVKTLLSMVQKETKELLAEKGQPIADLKKALADAMQEARDEAISPAQKDVDRAKMIKAKKDDILADGSGRMSKNSVAAEEAAGKETDEVSEHAAQTGKQAAAASRETKTPVADNNRQETISQFKKVKDDLTSSSADTPQQQGKDNFSNFQEHAENTEDSSWNAFWNKIDVTDDSFEPQIATLIRDGKNVLNLLNASGTSTDSSKNVNAQTKATVNARDIQQQVRNGILKNMSDGTSKLTLQLKPADLGTVTVMLQVKNKELHAVIRTENQDVTRVLAEQMTQLREQLEQQGLKVQELEVKTGLQNNTQQQNWHSAEHHNMQREREEMAQFRNRMRNLRIARGEATGGTEAVEAPIVRLNSNSTVNLIA